MIGSIIGGLIGKGGADAAAGMSKDAGQKALQLGQDAGQKSLDAGQLGLQAGQDASQRAYDFSNDAFARGTEQGAFARSQMSPWTTIGTSASDMIAGLLGMGHLTRNANNEVTLDSSNAAGDQQAGLNAFQGSPGYQFRQSEGVKAADRSASAKGKLFSGGQTKAVTEFGQGLASQEYNNYFNQLAGLSGQGLGATQNANNTALGAWGTGLTTAASTLNAGNNALLTGTGQNLQGTGQNAGAVGAGAGQYVNAMNAAGADTKAGANALASGIGSGINNAVSAFGMFGGFGGSNPGGFGGAGGAANSPASAAGMSYGRYF